MGSDAEHEELEHSAEEGAGRAVRHRADSEDTPLGGPAQPSELAGAFVFLASEESRFITGEVIAVTGGKLRS